MHSLHTYLTFYCKCCAGVPISLSHDIRKAILLSKGSGNQEEGPQKDQERDPEIDSHVV